MVTSLVSYISLQGPDNYPRKLKVTDNGDKTFKASYVPDDCGRYKVNVKYGGKEVPNSPFHVQSYATGNVSRLYYFINRFPYNEYHGAFLHSVER